MYLHLFCFFFCFHRGCRLNLRLCKHWVSAPPQTWILSSIFFSCKSNLLSHSLDLEPPRRQHSWYVCEKMSREVQLRREALPWVKVAPYPMDGGPDQLAFNVHCFLYIITRKVTNTVFISDLSKVNMIFNQNVYHI